MSISRQKKNNMDKPQNDKTYTKPNCIRQGDIDGQDHLPRNDQGTCTYVQQYSMYT